MGTIADFSFFREFLPVRVGRIEQLPLKEVRNKEARVVVLDLEDQKLKKDPKGKNGEMSEVLLQHKEVI